MSDTITLTPDRMRQIARYELTFRDLAEEEGLDEYEISCPEVYHYSLEDLTTALHNMKAANPTVKDFLDYWFDPIYALEDEFDIYRAKGGEDEEMEPSYYPLPMTDGDYFQRIWEEMESLWERWNYNSNYNDETDLSELLDLEEIFADLERCVANRGKPIIERDFSDSDKAAYIDPLGNEDFLKNKEEEELVLGRKFIEELCAKDDVTALRVKGYSCYGGDRLYPCNWPISRDCMIRLFDKTDDPQYANTLGYIYYYGRCTGGVPEYDKALPYFQYAAANGLYEGAYKLADMYAHGFGCKQSKRAAASLYRMVYSDSLKRFVQGDSANFADAALRMGNIYAKGIHEKVDPKMAYGYYLQAEYAAKLRLKESDFFGYNTVLMSARKALEETRLQLPKDYFKDHLDFDSPQILEALTDERHRCALHRHRTVEGTWVLTGNRVPSRACSTPESVLVILPELNHCSLETAASMTVVDLKGIWFTRGCATVLYDAVCYDSELNRHEFYDNDTLVAWVAAEAYRIEAPEVLPPCGDEYTVVTVRFSASGRSYDYLCDFEVAVGDTVIVNSYDGETPVEVVKVETRQESELALPLERYKKILRKA